MCPTCQISWIDADTNPAIGYVRTKARDVVFHGRTIHFETSEWYPICAEHAKQLSEPGMEIWDFETIKD
jgi:hypothetical protein